MNTKIKIDGTGFVPNGRVTLTFSAAEMTKVTVDCAGRFMVTVGIPNRDFFAHFHNQQFEVSTAEFDQAGNFLGKHTTAVFFLT